MSEATMPGAQGAAALNEDDVLYRKVFWRLVPILFGCYIIAYLDRVNIGFAKLQMLADLHLSEAVSLIAGVCVLLFLSDRAEDARWLTPAEKIIILARSTATERRSWLTGRGTDFPMAGYGC
jgi:hypothetical protein